MKSVSAGMLAHIQGEATTLATLWRLVRRDGVVFTFTDHDRDIVYGGDTYLAAAGYERAAVASGADLAVDETEITGFVAPGSPEFYEIRAGIWDHAAARLFAVNWSNTAHGEIKVRKATLGEFIIADTGQWRVEVRGLAQPLQQTVGSLYQPTCRAQLGDARCGMPLRPPVRGNSTGYTASTPAVRGSFMRVAASGSGVITDSRDEGGAIWECTTSGITAASDPGGWAAVVVGNTLADGSVVWTKRTAWTRAAVIDSVTDSTTLVLTDEGIETYEDGWFDGGVAIWETGDNVGVAREVISWDQSSQVLTLFAPPPFAPTAGDVIRIQPGCDQTTARCKVFGNYLNFRGEPFVPGSLAVTGVGA